MAKLYFKYGTMNSSKTAQLLMTAHNYNSQGKRILALKPGKYDSTREGERYIKSRAFSDKIECGTIHTDTDVYNLVKLAIHGNKWIDAVLIDEAQFMSEFNVKSLIPIVQDLDIPVVCFGLKNSYIPGELFEGSAALLYYSDKVEEIKTVCQHCERKATMNLRIVGGKPVYDGNPIMTGNIIASDAYYIPVCRKHFLEPDLQWIQKNSAKLLE